MQNIWWKTNHYKICNIQISPHNFYPARLLSICLLHSLKKACGWPFSPRKQRRQFTLASVLILLLCLRKSVFWAKGHDGYQGFEIEIILVNLWRDPHICIVNLCAQWRPSIYSIACTVLMSSLWKAGYSLVLITFVISPWLELKL